MEKDKKKSNDKEKVDQENQENKKNEVKNKIKENVEITKDSKEFKELEDVMKKQNKIPEEKMEKINKKILKNILMAICIMVYFIFINLGYININTKAFIIDLQVFSVTLIVTTIIIFEQAYKKDDGKLAINGIEILILAIITMILPGIYMNYEIVFMLVVEVVSMLFGIYYAAKSIIIYVKMKKTARKSEIEKIAKKKKRK